MLDTNGFDHALQIGHYADQGGAIEEVWAWCHTCDPEGSNLMKEDFWDNERPIGKVMNKVLLHLGQEEKPL